LGYQYNPLIHANIRQSCRKRPVHPASAMSSIYLGAKAAYPSVSENYHTINALFRQAIPAKKQQIPAKFPHRE